VSEPIIIVITGLPGTGKTTLGQELARRYRLPFIYKDGIKELLFERLGWKDRPWSKVLGQASYDLLYYFLEAQLRASAPAIIESNFQAEFDAPRLEKLRARYPFTPFQILCRTDGPVLVERYKRRPAQGERHPGHVDHLAYDELYEILLHGEQTPLPLDGPLFEIDTNDLTAIDYSKLYSALDMMLPQRAGHSGNS